MSGHPSPAAFIPCHFIAYRMIPSEWVEEDGTLDPAIFYRRKIDKEGISLASTVLVGFTRMTQAKKPRAVEGALSLHVGWVRNIDTLDVARKYAADTHPILKGLPFSHIDPKEAERLAEMLLEIARKEPLPSITP